MFAWSISASAWRSASKRATTCFVSIPSLMILSATFRRTGSSCSAIYTTPQPPFAKLFPKFVPADHVTGLFGEWGSQADWRKWNGRWRGSRLFGQETFGRIVGEQQSLDALPEMRVPAASARQVGRSLVGRQLQRREENRFRSRGRRLIYFTRHTCLIL
jgi:hypothetical protein